MTKTRKGTQVKTRFTFRKPPVKTRKDSSTDSEMTFQGAAAAVVAADAAASTVKCQEQHPLNHTKDNGQNRNVYYLNDGHDDILPNEDTYKSTATATSTTKSLKVDVSFDSDNNTAAQTMFQQQPYSTTAVTRRGRSKRGEQQQQQQSANSENSVLEYTPKHIFSEGKLHRLEELKRYQQLHEKKGFHEQFQNILLPYVPSKNYVQQQQNQQQLSSRSSTSCTFSSSFSSSPLSSKHVLSPSSSSNDNIRHSSSSIDNIGQSSSSAAAAAGSFTQHAQFRILLEEKLMSLVDKSALRITIATLLLISALYMMLSTTDSLVSISTASTTANSTMDGPFVIFSTSTTTTMILKRIMNQTWRLLRHYVHDIFITNMKIFIFVIVFGMVLNILLLSAFDNVDIPMIINPGRLLRNDDEEEEKEGENRHHQKQKQQPSPHAENKNQIIRQYAIEHIRKGTAFISLCIAGCGLVKGIVYTTLYLFHQHVYQAILNYYDHRDDESCVALWRKSFWLIQWIEYIISALFSKIVMPICNRLGISWIWNIFISSLLNSSKYSLCTQCIHMIGGMMIYIGVFVLGFYLLLIHYYPQKNDDVSYSRINDLSAGSSSCDHRKKSQQDARN
jgi:hypothetical protein